jgi:hypothetical protein
MRQNFMNRNFQGIERCPAIAMIGPALPDIARSSLIDSPTNLK